MNAEDIKAYIFSFFFLYHMCGVSCGMSTVLTLGVAASGEVF